jgi:hypothetical protein
LFVERQNAFVDKVIKDLEAVYKKQQDDVLNVAQKSIDDKRKCDYNSFFHENSRAKTVLMADESEKSHINTVQKSTNIDKSRRITQINIKRLNSPFFLREFGG